MESKTPIPKANSLGGRAKMKIFGSPSFLVLLSKPTLKAFKSGHTLLGFTAELI